MVKRTGRKAAWLLALCLMVSGFSPVPVYAAASATSQWAVDTINSAESLGIVPDSLSGADMSHSISRGEFAALVVRLYETMSGSKLTAGSVPFTDVSGNSNYDAICKAYAAGLASGYSNTTFGPNDPVTREQAATILTRVVKKYKYPEWTVSTDSKYVFDISGVPTFADDVNISGWARRSVYYLSKNNIISGVGNNNFAPKSSASREQAIIMATKIYNRRGSM